MTIIRSRCRSKVLTDHKLSDVIRHVYSQRAEGSKCWSHKDKTHSYAEVSTRIHAISLWLSQVHPHHKHLIVGNSVQNTTHHYGLAFAAVWLGDAVVSLDWRDPPATIHAKLRQVDAGIVVHSGKLGSDYVPETVRALMFPEQALQSNCQFMAPSPHVRVEHQVSSPVLYLFSGGTTGTPKVLYFTSFTFLNCNFSRGLLDDNAVPYVDNQAKKFFCNACALITSPPFYTGFEEVFRCNLAAGHAVVMSSTNMLHFDILLDSITKYKVTSLSGASTWLCGVLSHAVLFDDNPLVSVERMHCTGGPAAQNLLDMIKLHEQNTGQTSVLAIDYGLQDFGDVALNFSICSENKTEELWMQVNPFVPLEITVLHTSEASEASAASIHNPQHCHHCGEAAVRLVEWEVLHELGLQGGSGANCLSDGWFPTGDLAILDVTQHRLKIVGRKKNVILCNGQNVYPELIEDILKQHMSIENAAVFGILSHAYGEKAVAVVTLRQGATWDEAHVMKHCETHLPAHQLPKRVWLTTRIPLLASGKVDYLRMKTWALHQDDSSLKASNQGAGVHDCVHEIFVNVLGKYSPLTKVHDMGNSVHISQITALLARKGYMLSTDVVSNSSAMHISTLLLESNNGTSVILDNKSGDSHQMCLLNNNVAILSFLLNLISEKRAHPTWRAFHQQQDIFMMRVFEYAEVTVGKPFVLSSAQKALCLTCKEFQYMHSKLKFIKHTQKSYSLCLAPLCPESLKVGLRKAWLHSILRYTESHALAKVYMSFQRAVLRFSLGRMFCKIIYMLAMLYLVDSINVKADASLHTLTFRFGHWQSDGWSQFNFMLCFLKHYNNFENFGFNNLCENICTVGCMNSHALTHFYPIDLWEWMPCKPESPHYKRVGIFNLSECCGVHYQGKSQRSLHWLEASVMHLLVNKVGESIVFLVWRRIPLEYQGNSTMRQLIYVTPSDTVNDIYIHVHCQQAVPTHVLYRAKVQHEPNQSRVDSFEAYVEQWEKKQETCLRAELNSTISLEACKYIKHTRSHCTHWKSVAPLTKAVNVKRHFYFELTLSSESDTKDVLLVSEDVY
mmetsp:Transcript_13260/g.45880  ORF Transcript_13260/g.45880 Transcript_13260/m.45880 type:complete len:1068 (+) Transcript_13260:274-3477(+)|eukprot:CAMPEP_0183800222 /NCGR_PEP_ID=MMETSP0803_2-20130417/24164_1 /TAXON_ID=195967 /ORGANISM="Crustomastix stigmata, Strain CCMP3273" /LENGTH=1067 /DNA_ID=CAMNT_0026044933 /DNA_START=211 /DNA_END=3414 /DNA_ORIENTATION=-